MSGAISPRRVGVIAVSSVFLSAAALVIGAGAASAGRCDDEPAPGDVWVNVSNEVIVGVDPFVTPGGINLWVCEHVSAAPATWRDVTVGVWDPNTSTPGQTVDVYACDAATCGYVVAPTGAEVELVPVIEPPTDADGVTGATVGAGPSTCVYVASTTPSCSSLAVASVIVAEGDVVPGVSGTTVCVGRDTANPTVAINVLGSQTTNDIGVGGGPRCLP